MQFRFAVSFAFMAFGYVVVPGRADDLPNNDRNIAAIEEVKSGKRTTANAGWWGFDLEDSTDAIQSAIKSGAKIVVVPNVGKEWIVRPIQLVGNQEFVLEPGVVVVAKRGEFRGKGDCVFQATRCENLKFRGQGAIVRMQKQDYISGLVLKDLGWNRWVGQYDKAEWRMALSLRGCRNVDVTGVTLRDSGGDGIMISGAGKDQPSENIRIKDVVCDNNYRQGISVTNVDGLRVENCVFKNTWGTPPSAGVDIEPDDPNDRACNIVFRECRFENNYGDGIEVFLSHQNKQSKPNTILFEDCQVIGRGGAGIRVSKIYADGPAGLIEFRNCSVENTDGHGFKVQDKNADRAKVRFVNCTARNVANDRKYASAWTPIWLQNNTPDKTGKFGGIEFVDCFVEDSKDRPTAWMQQDKGKMEVADIHGKITIRSPHGGRLNLGPNLSNVTIAVKDAPEIATERPAGIQHVKVFHEPGRFGGWPANHGIWIWGNEILVGFSRGYHKNLGPYRHNIDREKPEEHWLARSIDGGVTWQREYPAEQGVLIPAGPALHGIAPPGLKEKQWRDCPGGIDFTHPDFAMTLRMTNMHKGPSRMYYSTDRGHRWEGPFRIPDLGTPGIAARTDYIVNSKDDCLLFLTAAKQDKQEGRPICARTTDGGKTWKFVANIGDEPKGYSIMPSTVRLGENELFTAVRCRIGPRTWLEAFRSTDNGQNWKLDNIPVPDMGEGNPAAMLRLADGRVCLTYGFRAPPYSMRARLSSDGGRTWGKEIILRDDGSGRDVGYPRSVQRPDGKVVTIYYFMDAKTGVERYIAATIWDPGK